MENALLICMPENIKKKLVQRHYPSGSSILLSEYDNEYVYFLIKGYAEAFIENQDGTITYVYAYQQGNIFGEIEPFYTGSIRPVSIVALTDCEAVILHKDDFLNWLEHDFNSVKTLIGIIAEKLVKNSLLIEEVSIMNVRERVLRCVALYQYRKKLHTLTKKQLSLEANTPIRSVNRAIMQCCQQGIICYKNKQIEVLDQELLNEYLPQYLKTE